MKTQDPLFKTFYKFQNGNHRAINQMQGPEKLQPNQTTYQPPTYRKLSSLSQVLLGMPIPHFCPLKLNLYFKVQFRNYFFTYKVYLHSAIISSSLVLPILFCLHTSLRSCCITLIIFFYYLNHLYNLVSSSVQLEKHNKNSKNIC